MSTISSSISEENKKSYFEQTHPSKYLLTLTNDSVYYKLCKRVLDIVVSVVFLILVMPTLISITTIQIIHSPKNPILFRQLRIGRDGRVFHCLKFRTMCVNADAVLQALLDRDPALRAEWATSQKLKNDPRISRVGHVLRVTSLDELPQIWNVLRGEMSLVGPRPVTDAEMRNWYEPLGGADAYRSVRPGITGLWQVSGRSGTTYKQRVELDCHYVSSLSPVNDMWILCRTIGAVLRQDGAC